MVAPERILFRKFSLGKTNSILANSNGMTGIYFADRSVNERFLKEFYTEERLSDLGIIERYLLCDHGALVEFEFAIHRYQDPVPTFHSWTPQWALEGAGFTEEYEFNLKNRWKKFVPIVQHKNGSITTHLSEHEDALAKISPRKSGMRTTY